MNKIEIKKYQIHEYKGLKIGIWKTADKVFTDFFEVTEAKAILEAQKIIDIELKKIGMELVDPSLPTHIYDRETRQVTLRWCLLEDKY